MLNMLSLCLVLGCADTPIDSNADLINERPDNYDSNPESLPHDDSAGYKPDMVLFHNVSVLTEGNKISCFDDGDDTPYCGVQKIILTVWEDYNGLSDENNCQVIHRLSPEYLVEIESESADLFVQYGAKQAWEFDAVQSFVLTTPLCDMIPEESDLSLVLDHFKTENVAFGYKPLSEAMLAEYKESFGSNYTEEEWTQNVEPYLLGMTNRVAGQYRTPNVGAIYKIEEETNELVVDDDGNNTLVPFVGSEVLPDGYYRAPPYYVYDITKFVPDSETSD
tara:strand:+ start:42146 stop:42979 length:834 start_codon:yes stop_codon:yes gene_type:complete